MSTFPEIRPRRGRVVQFPVPAQERHWMAAILAIAAAGIALRCWRIAAGLPDFLEEAFPLRIALGMKDAATGRVDWNPHFFNYPSLSIYLHFAVQQAVFGIGKLMGAWKSWADYLVLFQVDPSPMVLAARGFGIACDAATTIVVGLMTARLHRAAGVCAAALCAFSPILIDTSRSVYSDTVMVMLAVVALERTLAYLRDGDSRMLNLAALLVGLAAGAKYPAAGLIAALGCALFLREGRGGARRLALLIVLAVVGFLVTTPYALMDFAKFTRDFRFESAHAAEGHLGTVGRHAWAFHAKNLITNLGPLGTLAVLAAPFAAWRYEHLRAPFIVLGLALAAFAVPIALAEIEATRYLAPVIPIAAMLAMVSAFAFSTVIPARFRIAGNAVLAAALLAPVAVVGWRTASAGGDSTFRLATQWCTTHVGARELLIQEGYGAPLLTRDALRRYAAGKEFQAASPEIQKRLMSQPVTRVVAIPFQASGRAPATVEPPGGTPVQLDVFPHGSDFNTAFYDPRLLACADYVLTSSSVRSRYEADAGRYAAAVAAYAMLDKYAARAARFAPEGTTSGAELIVYRIGPNFRAAAGGEPDPLWWAAGTPDAFRRRAAELLGEPGATDLSAVRGWVKSLDDLYAKRVLEFADRLMMELMALQRYAPAAAIARGTLEALPNQVPACLVESMSLRQLGRPAEALSTIETTQRALGDAFDPAISLELARVHTALGNDAAARAELKVLIERLDAADPIAAEARRLLAG